MVNFSDIKYVGGTNSVVVKKKKSRNYELYDP
jgi:hypothetical protein